MKKFISNSLVLLAFLLPLCVNAQLDEQTATEKEIDSYISSIQKRYEIPGVSLAIIKNGETFYRNIYGLANIEHQAPLKKESIFRIYSLTKLPIAVGIFKLREEGLLDLEDSISKFMDDLPLAWQSRQIKHLLTHSSGFPDLAPIPKFQNKPEEEAKELVYQDTLKFDAGTRYDYNQTNFWILQKIIEKVSNQSIEDFILSTQFDNETSDVFFSSDSRDIIQDRVTAYFPFQKGYMTIEHPHLKGDYFFACNGLNLTMDQFMKWDERLKTNQLISADSKKAMWDLFKYNDQPFKKFTLGWDMREINNIRSYGFSGSMVTAYRTFPQKGISIIFLSNGLGNWYDIENVMNYLGYLVDPQINDKSVTAFEVLLKSAEVNIDEFKSQYQKLKKDDINSVINFEGILNSLGYTFLYSLDQPDKARTIFEMNIKENPSSWNVYDSMGECMEVKGDLQEAVDFYQLSIDKNVSNERGNNDRLNTKLVEMKSSLVGN